MRHESRVDVGGDHPGGARQHVQRGKPQRDGPVRQRANRVPVQAGHLRRHRQAWLLRVRTGAGPEPGRRAAQRRRDRRQRLEPGRPDQRHAELLALGGEPGHRAGRRHHGMGRVAGRADAPRAHHRQPAHGPDQPGHRPGLFERRFHRRQPRGRQRVHRLATAVVFAGHQRGRLVRRRLEHRVLRRGRRARAVVPGAAVHHGRHHAGVAREAVSLHRLRRQVPRVGAVAAHELVGRDVEHGRPDARRLASDEPVLRRQARRHRRDAQRRAGRRVEPVLHAGRLLDRAADQRHARQHRRAGHRLPDAAARQRRLADGGGRRRRRQVRRPAVRRRHHQQRRRAAARSVPARRP